MEPKTVAVYQFNGGKVRGNIIGALSILTLNDVIEWLRAYGYIVGGKFDIDSPTERVFRFLRDGVVEFLVKEVPKKADFRGNEFWYEEEGDYDGH